MSEARKPTPPGRLNHPNIITIHDSGQTPDGQLYFVMEFVDGTNLHGLIRGGGLDPAQALSIAAQVCDALAYAHGEGVVHRDIKPANIMVDRRGRVKVADFGLARLIGGESAETMGLTMTGTVMGTLDYMAPEQRRGLHVDHRADIFSLGVMFYEMLCREVPHGMFDPPSKRIGCDARLDAIVASAMQSAPESRFQSTQEMRAAIESARTAVLLPSAAPPLAPSPTPSSPSSPAAALPEPPRRTKAPLLIGIVAALAAIVAAFLFRPGKKTGIPDAPRPQAPAPAATQTPLLSPSNEPWAPATTSNAGGEVWQDFIAGLDRAKPKLPSAFQLDGTNLRVVGGQRENPNHELRIHPKMLPDSALRVTARGGPGRRWSLNLRQVDSPIHKLYTTELHRGGSVVILHWQSSRPTELARVKLPAGFVFEDPHTLEFRAEGDRLTVLLDGKEVATAQDRTLTTGGVSLAGDPGAVFEKIEWCELPASGASAAGSEQWVDALAEWWAAPPEKERGALVKEADGSRVMKNWGIAIGPAGRPLENAAVRATVRGDKASSWRLHVRNANAKGYRGAVKKSGKGILELTDGTSATTLATFDLPAGFSLAERHTAEFRAVGDLLTFDLDGQRLATVRDTARTKGSMLFEGEGTLIEKLEYLDLDSAPAAAAAALSSVPSGNLPWRDWLAERRKAGGWPSVLPDDGTQVRYLQSSSGSAISFPREATQGQPVRDVAVRVAPSLAAPAGDGPWTDLLAPLLAKGPLLSWWKQAGSGLQVAEFKGFGLDSKTYQDVAVRVVARATEDANRWRVNLRVADNGASDYAAEINKDGRGRLLLHKGGKESVLAAFDLPAGFAITDNHTLEFRVQGDRLSMALDGREMAAAHDATHSHGRFHLIGAAGTVFEKVEVRELGAP